MIKKILVITIVIFLLQLVFYNKAFALSRDGQQIIAYYFNYWGAPWGKTIDRGWNPWDVAGQNPNSLVSGAEPWRRNIATGDRITYPLIGPYDSSNPEVVRWQVKNAKNAGIDAFAIMLWTYEFDKNDIAGAKPSGYPTWGSQEWKVMKDVTIPAIAQEGFHFILGDEMVEAVVINCDYKNGPCPLIFDSNVPNNDESKQHDRCSNRETPCMFLGNLPNSCNESTTPCPVWKKMPTEVRQRLQENNNYLTHKRYADLVLNAYAGLTLATSPAYLRTGNRTNDLPNLPGMPYYYIPLLQYYRENHSISFNDSDMGHKLKRSLEVVEDLIGGRVAWFGYDGIVSWWDTPECGESCADFWRDFGKIYALVDGFGVSRSFIYSNAVDKEGKEIQGSGEDASQGVVNYVSQKVNSARIGFAPNIQTSFDDTILGRGRGAGDILNAQTNPAVRRNNGDTFKRSLRVYKNMPVKPDFYWLSSWNATYLEGYTVEPAIKYGDDSSTDPYHYLRILASDLTGVNFQPAPLPPAQSIDPLMWGPLGITPPTSTPTPTPAIPPCPQTSTLSCMTDFGPPYDCPTLRGGTCNQNYSCNNVIGSIGSNCCCEVHPSPTPTPTLTPILPSPTNIPPSPTSVPTTPIPGDITGPLVFGVPDGKVDIYDYNLLIRDFGLSAQAGKPGSPADIDGNGIVNIFDYNTLIGNFGLPVQAGK